VLYCDLVDRRRCRIAEREDYRELIQSFTRHACVAGGLRCWVANFIGDAWCVLRVAQAHEDDAERAARAGLAMVQAVVRCRCLAEMLPAVRVGIALARWWWRPDREGPAQEQCAVGTRRSAAQLQALAAPNQLVMDELT